MKFEWDENKNQSNIEKHGIDFETAARVFNDNLVAIFEDDIHSIGEKRFPAIGLIKEKNRFFSVIFTERGDVTRIISARESNKQEKEAYYEYNF